MCMVYSYRVRGYWGWIREYYGFYVMERHEYLLVRVS